MRSLTCLAALVLAGCSTVPDAPQLSSVTMPSMGVRDSNEQHRPIWHYTPPTGWMNDPNGMVYKDGEWHLYYQYYPHDTVWGPMHWAHAVSRDLVNWETLPVALAPQGDGYVFSGSAVIDSDNTAGFGKDAMVAAYTLHDAARAKAETGDHESQEIAWSLDDGRNFTRYSGNPVVPNPGNASDFRDPSVFRDKARDQWVMALSVVDHVQFYASDDLKKWRYLSSFGQGIGAQGGEWECPNLFPIRDAQTGDEKWVLIQNLNPGGPQGGSGTQYFVGDWDGKEFTLDPKFKAILAANGPVWLDDGPDNYAGITWNNAPNNRRVFIGWMSNWLYAQEVPTKSWRSAMTSPRELSLHDMELRQRPVAELEQLRGMPIEIPLGDGAAPIPTGLLPSAELDLTFDVPEGGAFTVELFNRLNERLVLGLDEQGWFIDRRQSGDSVFNDKFAAIHRAPRKHLSKIARVRILLDRASVELFADDGATVMTETFFPTEEYSQGRISWQGGALLRDRIAWPIAANKEPIK